jgi:hypothetical protein
MNPQQQARAELARRELARRAQSSTPPQQSEGVLDTMSNAADKITETIPAVAGLMSPTLGMAQYAGQQMNEASGKLGGAVTESVAENFPNAPTAVPVGLGVAASLASNPMSYMNPEAGVSTELKPFKGQPSLGARINERATGVKASSFERLRRDPGAFFSTASREQAGKNVGEAKSAAGIDPGITNDINSFTKENLARARSPQASSVQAQNAIADKLEAAIKQTPDAAPDALINSAGITPTEVNTALVGVNEKLSRLERSAGRGSPSFQKYSVIKDQLSKMLDQVAPGVRQANKDFSRVALRDEFLHTSPVNQSGTMSKIDAFGFTPAVVGAGAVLGGAPGAAAAYLVKSGMRSPFVRGAMTAARGVVDKVVDPALSGTANLLPKAGQGIAALPNEQRRALLAEFISRITSGKQP